MVKVFDVAKYVLEKCGEMSTWKLQKLCYYCQAWRNGPVCPELYEVLQGRFMISAESFKFGDSTKLDADEKESVDVVLKDYGELEPYDLRAITHLEDPWKNARGDLPVDANSDVEIPLESMGAYYGSL